MPVPRSDRADANHTSRQFPRERRRSSLHARLREDTAALHRSLETELDLLGPALSLGRYVAVLRAFQGYYAALEPRLAVLATHAPPAGFALRARTPLLERDLAELGLQRDELTALAGADSLPRLEGVEHLAGCLYVVEGATLGGQVISRAVEQRLRLTRARGCAFFSGDGAGTASRWRAVLHWIDELVAGGASADEVVSAAQETFGTLLRWARSQGAIA